MASSGHVPRAPDGTEHIYAGGTFNTDPAYSETYGHDLLTGAEYSDQEYRARAPGGRAFLIPAEYHPPHEEPSDEYPLGLTTGRTIYHWHTRTKTARVPELQRAAPDVWVELSPDDARRYGLSDGDLARVESRRGHIEARVRVCAIAPGVVFVPFHYGYVDEPPGDRPGAHPCAANELTLTEWDPVSKQPYFKVAAVRVTKIGDSGGAAAPVTSSTTEEG